MKTRSKSYFVIEMPNYKVPMLKNVAINVVEKPNPSFLALERSFWQFQ